MKLPIIHKIPGRTVLLTLVIFILSVVGFFLFIDQIQQREIAQWEIQVTQDLDKVGDELFQTINSRLANLTVLETYVLGEIDDKNTFDDFEIIAKAIRSNCSCIKNISIAPDGVQKWVYPLEGNEKVIGHDLVNDEREEVRNDVAKAIESGEIIISGPYQLRQGGFGLIARKAVYDDGEFWGLVAMVLDVPIILDISGVTSDLDPADYLILDDKGSIVWGDAIHNGEPSSFHEIKILNEGWSLIGHPKLQFTEGQLWLNRFVLVLGVLFITLASGFTFNLSSRRDYLNLEIAKIRKELSSLEEFNSISINSMDYGIHLIDPELKFILANETFMKWAENNQFDPNIEGKFIADVFPWIEGNVLEEYQTVLESKTQLITSESNDFNGETFHTETKKIPISKDADFIGVLTIIRDITEETNSKKIIEESNQKYYELFHSMIHGIALHEIIQDEDGKPIDFRFLEINKQFEEFTGLSAEMVVGKTVKEALPDIEDYWIDTYGNVALTGEVIQFENYTQEIGKYFSVSAYSPEKGKFITVFEDVTEKKLAEEKLQETLERLKSFDQHSTEGVYRIDFPDPVSIKLPKDEFINKVNETAVIGVVNDSLARMYGLTPEDMIGKQAIEFAPEYGVRASKIIAQDNFRVTNEETEDINKDGNQLFFIENYHGIIRDDHVISIWGAQNNITERKKAEQALKENESLLASSQKLGNVGSWLLNLSDNYLTWSDEVYRIFGADPQEFHASYEMFIEFVHSDDRDLVDDTYNASIQNGMNDYEIEHRIIRPQSGEIRWVYERCYHERNNAGEVIRSVGMVQDITERKLAEVIILENEERFRSVFNNSAMGIVVGDREINIIEVNRSMLNMFGYSRDEFLELGVQGISHPDDQLIDMAHFQKLINNEVESYSIEKRYFKKDGDILIGRLTISLINQKNDDFLVLGLLEDITQQYQTRQELILSEQRFSTIYNSVPVSIWEEDYSGLINALNAMEIKDSNALRETLKNDSSLVSSLVKKIKVADVNDQTLEMFGAKTKKELIGSLDKVICEKTTNIIIDEICAVFDRQRLFIGETTNLRLDGTEVDLFISIAFPEKEEDYSSVLVCMTDISQKVKAEMRFQESEKRFRAVFENSQDAIGVAQNGLHIHVNQSYLNLFGFDQETELVGTSIMDLIGSDERARIRDYTAMRSEGKLVPSFYETIGLKKDGSEFYMETSVSTYEVSGEVYSIVLLRDITEQKRIQQFIKDSEEKYRALYTNAPLSYQSLDENGCFLDINPAWEKALGYNRAEILGKWFGDILHPDHADLFRTRFPEFKESGSVSDVHFKAIRKDGEVIDIMFEGCAGYDDDGNFRQTYCVFQEITDKLAAETALIESENTLSILNDIETGIISAESVEDISDIVSQGLLNHFNCSRAAVAIVDHGSREIVEIGSFHNKGFSPNTPGEISYDAYEKLFPILRRKEIFAIRQLSSYDNHLKSLENGGAQTTFVTGLIHNDEIVGAIGITYTDSTDLTEAQNSILLQVADLLTIALTQAQLQDRIAESRARAQSLAQKVVSVQEDERQFISRELHDDTGQNLTALKVQLELIKNDIPDEYEQVKTMLEDSANLADTTLQKIRNLAHGLRPPVLDTIGLNDTLRELCHDYSNRVGLKIKFSGKDVQNLEEIKQISIYRILQEALTNITKHSQATEVKVDFIVNSSDVSLVVKDNGKGFEGTKKVETFKSGLGLANMRERVELIGGRFSIISEKNKGTTLTAAIPLTSDFIERRGNRT